ncbi:MAG: signal recognition particle-docking protein FtsY [Acidobacteriota bacterium]
MSIFQYREDPGYLKRLKEALQITKKDLSGKINAIMGTSESPMSEEQMEDLESVLISSDLGVATTMGMIDEIRSETRGRRYLTSFEVRRMLRRRLLDILARPIQEVALSAVKPHVILVVGVNGVGKTTTIGKLAHQFNQVGKEVLICASDTFRAAAVEQLMVWAERTGSEIVKQSSGTDPAAVLFDAIAAARARRKDIVIVDTAGRLHTSRNLMRELAKMKRIASREVEGAPHEIDLVLDATTGQNGLVQAREFLNAVGVTGIIVTKLDGTAKGGIVVSIARELKIPIRYIGIGERVEDLIPFSAPAFVDSLLDEG